MKDEKRAATGQANGSLPNRILGSLRDALNAASRDDRSGEITLGDKSNQAAARRRGRRPAAGSARPPEMAAAAPSRRWRAPPTPCAKPRA